MARLFLSYHFPDRRLVCRVGYHLRKQDDVDPFVWDLAVGTDPDQWAAALDAELATCDAFVAFVGNELGYTQTKEIQAANNRRLGIAVVSVRTDGTVPEGFQLLSTVDPIVVTDGTLAERSLQVAERIVAAFKDRLKLSSWVPDDDVPTEFLFDYEKQVIEWYAEGQANEDPFPRGAPESWPDAPRKDHSHPNPVDPEVVGPHRLDDPRVVVDARERITLDRGVRLTFREAQPRSTIHYAGGSRLKAAIVVSGGVAPGTNAVIAGIVNRHELYGASHPHRVKVHGYKEGLQGLLTGGRSQLLEGPTCRGWASEGGSRLGTSRCEALVGGHARSREAIRRIIDGPLHDVNILYLVGGDGSMRAAHAIATIAKEIRRDLSVVAVPKTTDNDILWVWQSFGFQSSVEQAREYILHLHREVTSNPRLCVLQVFGSDSGFIAANAGLGSGICDAVLVPEDKFLLTKVAGYFKRKLVEQRDRGEMPHGILLIAETAVPWDASDHLDDSGLTEGERDAICRFIAAGRRVRGQTPDELRAAGMRMIKSTLQREIQKIGDEWANFRVFGSEPRHLIRAIPPSSHDVIFGQRLGAHAVDAAMAGFHDCMVSLWLTEFVIVPLQLVVLGRKRLPLDGAFWRSVLASTGQDDFGPD